MCFDQIHLLPITLSRLNSFSYPPYLCPFCFLTQDQFMHPRFSWMCHLPLEHEQLTSDYTPREKWSLPLSSPMDFQKLYGSLHLLHVEIWSDLGMHMFCPCMSLSMWLLCCIQRHCFLSVIHSLWFLSSLAPSSTIITEAWNGDLWYIHICYELSLLSLLFSKFGLLLISGLIIYCKSKLF